MHDMACLIWARDGAIATADAQIVINFNNAIGPNFCSGRGANMFAGWICAMHATYGYKGTLHLRIGSGFHIQNLTPLHARRGGIGKLAGRRTGLAAYTSAQICCHDITGHAAPSSLCTPTRTISAEEPVESVNANDIGTTVFILGAGLSLE